MTRYFIKEDEQRPDSAHDWWLRKDQYIIGKLYLGRSEAQQIAHQCNTYAELLAACKAADLYLDWGWGKLGPKAPPPEYPGKLLRSAIAKAEEEQ